MASCTKDDTPTAMDVAKVRPEYLLGKWRNDKNDNDFYKFTNNLTTLIAGNYKEGSDWLLGETTEDQAGTEFYYRVDGNKLKMQYKNMEMWLPRDYTLSELTETTLKFFEADGDVHSYTKVN